MAKTSQNSDSVFTDAIERAEAAIREAIKIGQRRQNAIKNAPTQEEINTAHAFERALWNHHTSAAAIARRIERRGRKVSRS